MIVSKKSVNKVIDGFKNDDVIIFPTDTVYGIGAKYNSIIGVQKIFASKKRPDNKPLAILCSSINQIEDLVDTLTNDAQIIIKKLMPGPLTIILKKSDKVSDVITKGLDTVGVRIPNHEVALQLIDKLGPLATSSANISGMKELNNVDELKNVFNDVEYIIDGDINIGIASTVVDLSGKSIKILREGVISNEDIENVLKNA